MPRLTKRVSCTLSQAATRADWWPILRRLCLGHLHYKSTLHALTDLYYIHPLWRRGSTALRLFGTAHRCLKARGVVKVLSGSKLHSGLDMTRLFTFMGYEHAENLFTKLL